LPIRPDWAVVFQVQDEFGEKRDKLYLERETKGSDDLEGRRDTENMKVDCALHHFGFIKVDYDVAASVVLPAVPLRLRSGQAYPGVRRW